MSIFFKKALSYIFTILSLFSITGAYAQNIVSGEFYFDVDPGYENGQAFSVNSSNEIPNHLENIDISTLPNGSHQLFIRMLDDQGNWSLNTAHNFVILNNPINTQVSTLEYFFGTDPGEGNGFSISITPNADIPNLITTISTSGISDGIHVIGVRSMDNLNQWSQTTHFLFLKNENESLIDLTELEYFFNVDPGIGNANTINLTSSTNVINFDAFINSSSLNNGTHLLGIRSKDLDNKWSHTNSILFLKNDQTLNSDITQLEYFYGMDPGQGNGNIINLTPSNNVINLTTLISTAGLTNGTHQIGFRSKDTNDKWSHVSSFLILKRLDASVSPVTEIEYFFGPDPGEGNAHPISLTPSTDLINLNTSINAGILTNGAHVLNIRSKDNTNKWSHSSQSLVLKRNYNINDIAYIEYYFDVDPGKSNGHPINLTAAPDINNLSNLIDVSGLSNGTHVFVVRSKDNQGKWSLDEHFLLLKQTEDLTLNIQQAEYFIGDDPGLGNGQAISVNPGNSIILLQTIDINNLNEEVKEIHIRTKDENGIWSQDHIHYFKKRFFETKNITIGEYFFDVDPGLNQGIAFSIPEDIDVSNLNVMVMASGLPDGLHDLYIRTKQDDEKWSLTNVSIDILVDQALPLRWLDFSAIKVNAEVLLKWSVAESLETSHFEIEKLIGNNFTKIGELNSINTSNEQNYQFRDKTPQNGWNHYRIKQLDLDGDFEYSENRSIHFSNNLDLAVYPNPTIEKIMISGLQNGEKYNYKIFNGESKEIKSGIIYENQQLDFSMFSPGAYLLVVLSDNHKDSFLIIKQ